DVAPTRWHVAGRGRQVRRSNGGVVRRQRRGRLLRQVGLSHGAQRRSLAILSSEAGRCKPLLVAADRLLDLLELQRPLVQQRRLVLALVLPRRNVAVIGVVALRLAVGVLILLAEVSAARLVPRQRVETQQLGELQKVGDPAGLLQRLVQAL